MNEEREGEAAAPEAVDESARRRRRERVFGEVLPESTSDDREPGAGERGNGGHDDWLRSNVPPHHG